MSVITLELAEAAFSEWRGQRSNPSESIPSNLWAMALGLYPRHTRSTICKSLRLSGGQFKQRLEGMSHTTTNTGFVLASRNRATTITAQSPEVTMKIQGKERVLTICVGLEVLGQIVSHIGALL